MSSSKRIMFSSAGFLLVALLLAAPLHLCTAASLPYPVHRQLRVVRSSQIRDKMYDDCTKDNKVSAICYNCASFSPSEFHTIHTECCAKQGPVRELCVEWYTEAPKRGRRNMWYY